MIVGEITVAEVLATMQTALDANDLLRVVQAAKDVGNLAGWKEEYLQGGFRARNYRKIEAVTEALRDVHRMGEVGNIDLYHQLILERWEAIDNE
jgi:hypothetical protein